MTEERTDPLLIEEYNSISKDDALELYKIGRKRLHRLEDIINDISVKMSENNIEIYSDLYSSDEYFKEINEAIKSSNIRKNQNNKMEI